MSNLNKVILIGRLTSEPNLRLTPKGTPYTELGLAVNRNYKTPSGEKREEVTFVDITFWGKTAEICDQYLSKGKLICVEGRLKFDTWNDKVSGQKRSKLFVLGENMHFLEPATPSDRPESNRSNPSPQPQSNIQSSTSQTPYGESDSWDEPPF